jgi:hypothetical protein
MHVKEGLIVLLLAPGGVPPARARARFLSS